MEEIDKIIEGLESPLYNKLSKYLPDDFPPGPPFKNDYEKERFSLIGTIEDFTHLNTEIWGKDESKSHGFLWHGVPLKFNWIDFALTYGPKLDQRITDPRESLQALYEIYVGFGFSK